MPIELVADDNAGELAPGQFAYETIGEIVRELEPEALMTLVGAIQRGESWPRLSRSTRQIFVDLEEALFEDGED